MLATVSAPSTLNLLDTVPAKDALTFRTRAYRRFELALSQTREILAIKFFTSSKAKESTVSAKYLPAIRNWLLYDT
jgi:hypothetical protein